MEFVDVWLMTAKHENEITNYSLDISWYVGQLLDRCQLFDIGVY